MSNNVSSPAAPPPATTAPDDLRYIQYDSSRENEFVPAMRRLISKDLSEPYSIYVYRYFLYQWGDLCFLAMDGDEMVGVVVSKLEPHHGGPLRGYIAMLAVREEYRGKGIATRLVRMAIDMMIEREADEVCFVLLLCSACARIVHMLHDEQNRSLIYSMPQIVLETEITNIPAMKLYERLGFLRSKRLHRYYLNGNSAYRLVLYLKEGVASMRSMDPLLDPLPGPAPMPPLMHGNGHR